MACRLKACGLHSKLASLTSSFMACTCKKTMYEGRVVSGVIFHGKHNFLLQFGLPSDVDASSYISSLPRGASSAVHLGPSVPQTF